MALDNPTTIVWDERVQGFTTFQTYTSDSGLSLNNKYYTFKRGTIWEHNVPGVSRNTFYDADDDSIVDVVFNDDPSVIKNFQTIGFEGQGTWSATISTDQESVVTDNTTVPATRSLSGSVDTDEFVNREGKRFAYIRGKEEDVTNLSLERISVQGLGAGDINVENTNLTVSTIPAELNVGDNVFFFQHSIDVNMNISYADQLRHVGVVTARDGDVISYDFTDVVGSRRPASDDFFLFSKDNVAETSGVIGFYGIVRFRTSDNAMAELFAINSEVISSST